MASHRLYNQIREIIGDELAERLSIDLGGRRIYFSEKHGLTLEKHDQLIRSIGYEAAKKLNREIDRLTMVVPLRGRKIARNRMIKLLANAGNTVNQISALTGLCEDSVFDILSRSNR